MYCKSNDAIYHNYDLIYTLSLSLSNTNNLVVKY